MKKILILTLITFFLVWCSWGSDNYKIRELESKIKELELDMKELNDKELFNERIRELQVNRIIENEDKLASIERYIDNRFWDDITTVYKTHWDKTEKLFKWN